MRVTVRVKVGVRYPAFSSPLLFRPSHSAVLWVFPENVTPTVYPKSTSLGLVRKNKTGFYALGRKRTAVLDIRLCRAPEFFALGRLPLSLYSQANNPYTKSREDYSVFKEISAPTVYTKSASFFLVRKRRQVFYAFRRGRLRCSTSVF